MLFNSFVFALFFPTILILYWAIPFRYKLQNSLLLIGSYYFYGYWDWRFLSLIAISTIIDYFAALHIHKEQLLDTPRAQKRAKKWLILSICTNLGILGFFKYFNFFIDSLTEVLSAANVNPDFMYLNIILPVGISFYTFQTMSYTIDVYRRVMKPTKDFLGFAVYVSFFPQLVAGPIERAKDLLPRILKKREFKLDQFYEGLHLIILGLFKKVYVADNIAPLVDRIFTASTFSSFDVLMGSYLFAFQVYCDFSGYTDIARGCAKCMGIELMVNFRYPFVAVNPSDFWRRWHISLSTWLADYLYIPLGGSRKGIKITYRNLFLTMLLGGLWHGAAWNFVLWGAFHGILLMVYKYIGAIYNKNNKFAQLFNPKIRYFFNMILMFNLLCVSLVFFRSHSLVHIKNMLIVLFSWQGSVEIGLLISLFKFAGPLIAFEALYFFIAKDDWSKFQQTPMWIKSTVYAVIFYLTAFYGASAESFIYFQF